MSSVLPLGAVPAPAGERRAAIPVSVRPRRAGRWISGMVVLALLVLVLRSLIDNPRLEWAVVARYLGAPSILEGVAMARRASII